MWAPAVWAKPVVDSVLIPAHAQTTISCSEVTLVEDFDADIDKAVLLYDGMDCELIPLDILDDLGQGTDASMIPDLLFYLDVDVIEGADEIYDIRAAGSNDWLTSGLSTGNQTGSPLEFTATRLTGPSTGLQIMVTVYFSFGPAPLYPVDISARIVHI